jgi:hypothetical protein
MSSIFAVHGVRPDVAGVDGMISLVVWTIVLVVMVKYVTFVMRADNRGEGGIMALVALVNNSRWGTSVPGEPAAGVTARAGRPSLCSATIERGRILIPSVSSTTSTPFGHAKPSRGPPHGQQRAGRVHTRMPPLTVQHADNTDETALPGTRRHTCAAAAASSHQAHLLVKRAAERH